MIRVKLAEFGKNIEGKLIEWCNLNPKHWGTLENQIPVCLYILLIDKEMSNPI